MHFGAVETSLKAAAAAAAATNREAGADMQRVGQHRGRAGGRRYRERGRVEN